jgi:hypothetical protein
MTRKKTNPAGGDDGVQEKRSQHVSIITAPFRSTQAGTPDTAPRRPERFGREVPAIARFIASQVAPFDPAALQQVDRHFPDISFRDFMAAVVLAAALVSPTEGRA